MTLKKAIDAHLELLLAGDPAEGDSLDRDLSALISEINELVPEPVIPPGIAEAHIAKIVETAGALGPQPVSQPAKTTRLGWRAQLSSLLITPTRKIAAATLSLTVTFSGLAYAGLLPDPIQRTAADIARWAGVSLPDPDVTTDDSDSPAVTDDPGSESLTPDPDRNNNGEPVDESGQASDDGGPSVDGKDKKERNGKDKKKRNGKDKKERNGNPGQGDHAAAKHHKSGKPSSGDNGQGDNGQGDNGPSGSGSNDGSGSGSDRARARARATIPSHPRSDSKPESDPGARA